MSGNTAKVAQNGLKWILGGILTVISLTGCTTLPDKSDSPPSETVTILEVRF